ncbi:Hpt domain-containing response regulator [Tunturiibacter gelidiferens]|uniref:response regulator n=1 Tax=Tunturiibacter gelidiferens TaxID=3069689 RepID=UPI003D9BA804
MPVQILIVDDDELSREVLMLLVERAGYEVEAVESGDAALAHVQRVRPLPEVVLTDMQMPGTAGDELARRLRELCGVGTLLLAMSGSKLEDGTGQEFDGFLLKPFTMKTLAGAISGGSARVERGSSSANGGVLDEDVYGKLSDSMRRSQLEQLYALCLKDAEARIGKMRRATSDGDDAAYKKEAHAVKGGCGMVGAIEMQRLATSMEERGLCDDDVATLDEFMVACERLRRILIARESN